MKFTDLTAAQRSMLTMLCTGQTFNTEELGRGCNPRFRLDQAAASLLSMRDHGLVFSNQTPVNKTYAEWKASEYGHAVFKGRPAGVPLMKLTPGLDEGTPAPGTWVVYRRDSTATGEYIGHYASEQDACAAAAKSVDSTGKEFHVAKLVARVKPVSQPTFEIERV